MRILINTFFGLLALIFVGWLVMSMIFKPRDPNAWENRPCSETIEVTERNGQKVFRTKSGLYIKATYLWSAVCDLHEENMKVAVRIRGPHFNWHNGTLYTPELFERLDYQTRQEVMGSVIIMLPTISFGDASNQAEVERADRSMMELVKRAIPHQLYPIDLLPPKADKWPNADEVFWVVRNVKDARGVPFWTRCDIRPPAQPLPNRPNGHNYMTDADWLVQGETYTEKRIDNTCRGYVDASNGKLIGAMLDVPGAAVKDIDKIYAAVSAWLSTMIVE